MSTASKAKGTAAETAVVRYLQNWWPTAERRALSGALDKGDVAGIARLVVEVKAAERPMLAAWQRETLTEMKNAGAVACMLVVKRKYKVVGSWDAYVPVDLLGPLFPHFEHGEAHATWVRMDVALAAALFKSQGF